MSKRQKTAEEYLADAGFDDSMPFDLMVQILSNLSPADILSLHGSSKYVKNNRFRRATTAVIKQKVEARLNMNVVKQYIVGSNINYRLLLIALLTRQKNNTLNSRVFFTVSNDSDEYVGYITIMRRSIFFVWNERPMLADIVTQLQPIIRNNDLTIGQSYGLNNYVLPFDKDMYLETVLAIYFILKSSPDIGVANESIQLVDTDKHLRIRCAVCNVNAKLECKECKTYFCSEECHY